MEDRLLDFRARVLSVQITAMGAQDWELAVNVLALYIATVKTDALATVEEYLVPLELQANKLFAERVVADTAIKEPRPPSFGWSTLTEALGAGKFRPMEGHDFDAFAGAMNETLICDELDGWMILFGPALGNDDSLVLRVEAYRNLEELAPICYLLGVNGEWEQL